MTYKTITVKEEDLKKIDKLEVDYATKTEKIFWMYVPVLFVCIAIVLKDFIKECV
jgi:hypothetical protein